MIEWLTQTTLGRLTATFLISTLPVVELRGGLPFGMGLSNGSHRGAAGEFPAGAVYYKGRIVRKYSLIGLVILVGIPLPGTGAWTGALVAAFLDMRVRQATPAIFLGLLMAAGITTLMTLGVIHLL